MIKNRISRLRRLLRQRDLPALLVTIPANRFYLSGFTPDDGQPGESSGALLISQSSAIILTDFRYQLTAASQAEYFDLQVYPRGLALELKTLLDELGIKKLAIEAMGLLVGQMRQMERILSVELVPTEGLVEELRVIKDKHEIALIEKSLHIMEQAVESIFEGDIAGQREDHLAHLLLNKVRELGADGFSFDPIVASGANGAEPHAHAGGDMVAAGSPLVVDTGASYKKYASDITRTYLPAGKNTGQTAKPDANWEKVYKTVYAALQAAISGIRPGMTGAQADELARTVIEEAGYGKCFGHSLGHGVGLMVHESPSLSPRSLDVLMPGMVFTLEPGIYLPGWGGVRLEQMVELTPKGPRVLNQYNGFYSFES